MNQLDAQQNPLYLKPPRFGEFIWALSTGIVPPSNATRELYDLFENSNYLPILKRPFALPDWIDLDRESFAGNLMMVEKPTRDYLDEVYELEGRKKLERMYELLRPKATIKRGEGYCSSISILTVTFLRKLKLPARFNTRKEKHDVELRVDHIYAEVYEQGGWREYLNESVAGLLAPVNNDPKYDKCYEEFLELINSKNDRILKLIKSEKKTQTKMDVFSEVVLLKS